MKIKIQGTGCPKCRALEENALEAVTQLGVRAEVEKVTDLNEILRYDVMMTPGLVVDGEVKTAGKVVPVEKIKQLLVEPRES